MVKEAYVIFHLSQLNKKRWGGGGGISISWSEDIAEDSALKFVHEYCIYFVICRFCPVLGYRKSCSIFLYMINCG
jgi:hypothetical protein